MNMKKAAFLTKKQMMKSRLDKYQILYISFLSGKIGSILYHIPLNPLTTLVLIVRIYKKSYLHYIKVVNNLIP